MEFKVDTKLHIQSDLKLSENRLIDLIAWKKKKEKQTKKATSPNVMLNGS